MYFPKLTIITGAAFLTIATATKIEFCNELVDGKCPYGSSTCISQDLPPFDKLIDDLRGKRHATKCFLAPDSNAKGDAGSCGRVYDVQGYDPTAKDFASYACDWYASNDCTYKDRTDHAKAEIFNLPEWEIDLYTGVSKDAVYRSLSCRYVILD